MRWRIEPHRFRQRHFYVSQARNIFVGGQTAFEFAINFNMEAALALGILREQIPRPGERLGRGLVTRHENRHHLVTNFLCRHAAACLSIARRDKASQQIPWAVVRFAAASAE